MHISVSFKDTLTGFFIITSQIFCYDERRPNDECSWLLQRKTIILLVKLRKFARQVHNQFEAFVVTGTGFYFWYVSPNLKFDTAVLTRSRNAKGVSVGRYSFIAIFKFPVCGRNVWILQIFESFKRTVEERWCLYWSIWRNCSSTW